MKNHIKTNEHNLKTNEQTYKNLLKTYKNHIKTNEQTYKNILKTYKTYKTHMLFTYVF